VREPVAAPEDAWPRREVPSRSRLLTKRAWFETKTIVARYPIVALPIARWRHGRPVDDGTEIVIEAFPRSGMTFAVVAFEMAQPAAVSVACHVHAPAQLIEASRRRLPALMLIREPEPTILSFVIRHPHVTMRQALRAYARFYEPLLGHRDDVVVSRFADVTADFGAVTRRVNMRFGTRFAEFAHTPANVDRAFASISSDYEGRTRSAAELERTVARPSAQRDRIKAALREGYRAPALARSRDRAESVYAAMTSAAATSGDGRR
jgi:hypothetical protein